MNKGCGDDDASDGDEDEVDDVENDDEACLSSSTSTPESCVAFATPVIKDNLDLFLVVVVVVAAAVLHKLSLLKWLETFKEYREPAPASDKRLEQREHVAFEVDKLFLSRLRGRICSTPFARDVVLAPAVAILLPLW